jgi:hypothetical protein
LDDQIPLKPIYLDEEWQLRRSERIFLSEPSPQPSPTFSMGMFKECKALSPPALSPPQRQPVTSLVKSKSEKAKLKKAKTIQELSQKVQKKYKKCKKTSGNGTLGIVSTIDWCVC